MIFLTLGTDLQGRSAAAAAAAATDGVGEHGVFVAHSDADDGLHSAGLPTRHIRYR